MRYIKGILTIAAAAIIFTACSTADPKTPQELRTDEMLGTWIIETITIDGLDASANYPLFKIDFQSSGIYSSVNGGRVFRPTGTWTWPNSETTTELQLDVFTDVVISSFEDRKMTWTFNYVLGGVRAGTNGTYVVTFVKF